MKLLQSLKLKKYREKYGLFVIEGPKIIKEVLRLEHQQFELICITADFDDASLSSMIPKGVDVLTISSKEMKNVSNFSTPSSILAVAKKQELAKLPTFSQTLYLQEIQDPGNLGTIIRTAVWFGLPYIVIDTNSVDAYHPKVLQASMGAFAFIQIYRLSWRDVMNHCDPDAPIYVLDANGQNMYQSALPKNKGIFVFGNEGKGVDYTLLRGQEYHRLAIPKKTNEPIDSLNLSISVGILLSELNRG